MALCYISHNIAILIYISINVSHHYILRIRTRSTWFSGVVISTHFEQLELVMCVLRYTRKRSPCLVNVMAETHGRPSLFGEGFVKL